MTSFNHQFTVEGGGEEQKGKDEESKRAVEGEKERVQKRRETERQILKEEESKGGRVIY